MKKVMKKVKGQNISVSSRIPEEFFDVLSKIAEREQRTISQLILFAISDFVEKRKQSAA